MKYGCSFDECFGVEKRGSRIGIKLYFNSFGLRENRGREEFRFVFLSFMEAGLN
jgi:hypothetical protein